MKWAFGDLLLDPERFELTRSGNPVRVEPQVLSLLIHLVRNRERMVTKDEIVAVIWHGQAVSDASISSRIHSARQAVGDDGSRQAVIHTVHGRGFRFVARVTTSPAHAFPDAVLRESPEHPEGRPSIAILPFKPLGLSEDLVILGDAIPHDIIQALCRLRWLAVIARGSSFRFRQTETDVDTVSAALAARYVLNGIIENTGNIIAVTLELTDSHSRELLWADRLVASLDDVAELRATIVAHLVAALDAYIPLNESRHAQLSDPNSLDAWANYHVGLGHLFRFTTTGTRHAQTCFERSVKADPQFARAHAGLSFTSFLDAFLRQTADQPLAIKNARRHAERSLELDILDPFANFTMGRSFWLTNEPDIAADWLARATELNPNYAQGFYASAFTSMLKGNGPATFSSLDAALSLSPLDPLLYGMHGVRAQMLLQQEDYDAAARWSDRAANTHGAHYLIAMIAVAANGLAGRHAQAARWRQKVRHIKPDATGSDYFRAFPTRDNVSRARIQSELSRNGF